MFSQRQGFVTIVRANGTRHELMPVGDTPGAFEDLDGRPVLRELDLGDQGLIFRFPDLSLYVFWDTSALEKSDPTDPTWPFSTRDYDATTLLRCREVGHEAFSTCPAGILRMDGGEASIVVQGLDGDRFTINFLTAYVNATNRTAEARLNVDTWTVIIDGAEEYHIPLAAIEGG